MPKQRLCIIVSHVLFVQRLQAIERKMKKVSIFLLLLAVIIYPAEPSKVTVSQGGYHNLLLAFEDNIPETEADTLRTSLTELFKAVSTVLKTATFDKLYFAQLIVLVPSTWMNHEWFTIEDSEGWEKFEEADFRVTSNGDPKHGGQPYAVQDQGCGKEGKYVHLGKDFILRSGNSDTDTLNSARAVVREWARYRYGVFEEDGFNQPDYPDFYYSPTGHKVVNTCNNTIVSLQLVNCTVDPVASYNEECSVVVDSLQNSSLHSSIMTNILHNHADRFCDSGTNRTHNVDAPNRHNALCGQRNVWDVISSHNDFTATEAFSSREPALIIKFVRPQDPRIFIQWDDTRFDNTQLNAFKYAVMKFIMVDLAERNNVYLAASSTINDQIPEPQIVNSSNADIITSEVTNLFKSGSSKFEDLSSAIDSAVQVWEQNEMSARGSVIVLISNRDEQSLPLSTLTDTLQQSGVILHLFTALKETVTSLGPLARDTGGRLMTVSLPSTSNQEQIWPPCKAQLTYRMLIGQGLSTVLNSILVANTDREVEIYQQIHNSTAKGTGEFMVDSTMAASGPSFYVHICRSSDKFTTELKTPVGLPFSPNMPFPKPYVAYRSTPLYKSGVWEYSVSKEEGLTDEFAVVVSGRSKQMTPVTVNGWFMTSADKGWPEVVLFASVMRGSTPVSGACVTAILSEANGKPIETVLLDNGRGDPDVMSGDGIYSRYFISEEKLAVSYQVALSVKSCGDNTGSEDDFTRVYSIGAFAAPKGTWPVGVYPPGRVTDLRVTSTMDDTLRIRIQWTATGDDLDFGAASLYVMKCAPSIADLNTKFDQLTIMDMGQVNGQPISSVQSGEKVSAYFSLNNRTDVYCAMKALDASGKFGELSNTITVLPPYTGIAVPEDKKFTRKEILVISVLSLAGFIVLLLLCIIVVLCATRTRKDKIDKKEDKKAQRERIAAQKAVPPVDTVYNIPVNQIRFGSQDTASVASSSKDWDTESDRDDHSEVGSDATHSLSWKAFQPGPSHNWYQEHNDRSPIRNAAYVEELHSRLRRPPSPVSTVSSFVSIPQIHNKLGKPPSPPPKNTNARSYPLSLQLGIENHAYSEHLDNGNGHVNLGRRRVHEVQV